MEYNHTTSLRISLKPSEEDIYQVIEENPRGKLQRSVSVQVRVQPIRSQVLLSRPASQYEVIEEEYANAFAGSEYVNMNSDRMDTVPTPPPRDIPRVYSIIHDGYNLDDTPTDEFCTNSLNDATYNFNNLPLVKELENLKFDVHYKFNLVRHELKAREEALISSIDEAKNKYRENIYKHRMSIKKINTRISKLQALGTISEQSSQKMNECNSMKYACIQTGVEETHLGFYIRDSLSEMVRNYGELRKESVPEYSKMSVTNRQYTGKTGNNVNTIALPMGLAVDQNTNNVYVVDQGVPKVCIVSPDGRTQVFGKTNVMLKQPHGICVKNGKVYVTDNNRESNCGEVFVFSMKGKLLGKCTTEGGMSQALGISVDTSENIYVCDGVSHCIHLFDSKFNHKEDVFLAENTHPLDIKVTGSAIYILAGEDNKWSLFVLDKEFQQIMDVLEKDIQVDFGNVQFFTIDSCGNLIIADQTTHCLHVISKYGEQITNIVERDTAGHSMPNGVDISRENKIVTSWLHRDTALRIF